MTLNIQILSPPDNDLFFDVAGLPSPFRFPIPLCIANNETIDLYFRALLVNPSADWQVASVDLGLVAAGGSACFLAEFSRLQPTLTAGEFDETITLRIEAYTDATYTTLYGSSDKTLIIRFIDHTDPAWTILYNDNFDDGTQQGWAGSTTRIESVCLNGNIGGVSSLHYISAPYSLALSSTTSGHTYKSYTIGAYTKAYIVIHVYSPSGTPSGKFAIKIDNKLVKPCNVPAPNDVWLRYVFPLPVNATVTIRLSCANQDAFIDNILVIAK